MAKRLNAHAIEEILPKRRGRPPKIQTAFDAPKRRGRPPLTGLRMPSPVEPPKRRGRPPLIRTAIEGPPKRRGRPPLAKTGMEPPKRRGRPPMARAAKETEAPKRRGRPPAARKGDEGVKKAFPLIGRNDLNRLLEEAAIYHNRASSATGALGELIKDYVQKKHLHAGAFRIVNRWKKMGDDDPQKLWLELAHVDDMREKSGLDRIAKAQGQLLPAIADEPQKRAEPEPTEPEIDDEPEAASEPKEDRVMNYPREVEERAGDAA
jgi:hypothetical protein